VLKTSYEIIAEREGLKSKPFNELLKTHRIVISFSSPVQYVISRGSKLPDRYTEGEEILVPTFEIGANPQIRLSEIKSRRYYIVDRAQMKAKEAIRIAEDNEILGCLNAFKDPKRN
jgi:hypothetical protein